MSTSIGFTPFNNGPLPKHLEEFAYFTPKHEEWALPREKAIEYLLWCQQNSIRVLGLEVWYPTVLGPTVAGVGSPEGIEANLEVLRTYPERGPLGQFVFNICAESD